MGESDGRRGDTGLGLSPGDRHYRAYVGPPQNYDLVAAMTFNLLTVLGLRQHHTLLDIGCGSLRVGRLLIPYLNPGNYLGIEPNRWLVEEGILREVGRDQVEIKRPEFVFSADPESLATGATFDFALAQSIFSHAGADLIQAWLCGVCSRLKAGGALVATFLSGAEDHRGSGWVYPACVEYTSATMAALAASAGLDFRILDWAHPRQTWALFSVSGSDRPWPEKPTLSWNASLASGAWGS